MILYGHVVHNKEPTHCFRNLTKGKQQTSWSKLSTTRNIFPLASFSISNNGIVLAHMRSVNFAAMAYVYEVAGSNMDIMEMGCS